jgi:hypothetical protein
MKSITLLLLIVLLNLSGSAQSVHDIPNAMSMNDTRGREFWIAIPQNEVESHPTERIEIHLLSTLPCSVTVTDFSSRTNRTYTLNANEDRVLTDARGDVSWASEVVEAEVAVPKGIRVQASAPISVFVMNSKQYSHDGYRALPIHTWGREYIPVSYYDFKEFAEWAGGFVVVAAEPTTVEILLRGTGEGDATTMGGRKINTNMPFTISLDSGEVYMVRGDGKTRGQFDLSGSRIRSDRPVGVLSFHMKTSMPNLLNGGGRQHLVEMSQPVSTWGKTAASVEFTRLQAKGPGSGDVFRVMSTEPGTKWTVTSFDPVSKKVKSRDGGTLLKAGDFADLSQSSQPTALISGFSLWEADKPIRVVQYATSWMWDYNTNLDPFMVEVPSLNASVQQAVFSTSANPRFTTHIASLVVRADPSSATYMSDLESLTLDDVPLWKNPQARIPGLKSNLVQGDLHFVSVEVPSNGKPHVIRSNSRVSFSGYVVGSAADEAFGWPIAGSVRPALLNDKEPPVLNVIADCQLASVSARDVSGGIAWVDTVAGAGTTNVEMINIGQMSADRDRPLQEAEFYITIKDSTLPARCVFYVQDWADNITVDSVSYYPVGSIDTMPPVISRVDTTVTSWTFQATDVRNIPPQPLPCPTVAPQVESGLDSIELLALPVSRNIGLVRLDSLSKESLRPTLSARFRCFVTDPKRDAKAVFEVVDHRGNRSRDSVSFSAPTSMTENRTPVTPLVWFDGRSLYVEHATEQTPICVTIHDVSGRRVSQGVHGSGRSVIPLDLPLGLYVVLAQVGASSQISTFIVLP